MNALCSRYTGPTAALLMGLLITATGAQGAFAEEAVRLMFLGNMGFQLTTPAGKVILTDPWLEGNPDAPLGVEGIERADLIVVSGAHGDNVDDTVEVAKRTRATVIATSELGAFLVEQGLPSGQLHSMMPGGLYRLDDLTVKVVHAVHTAGFWARGEPTPGYGGMSIGFVITFDDGLRLYFSGDTGLFGDLRLFGELYRPHVAILSVAGRYMMEPEDGALAAEFLRTGNNSLHTVIPGHHRLGGIPAAEAPVSIRLREAIEERGLPVKVLSPEPGKSYRLTK